MADLLKRSLAPIPDEAWAEIDEEASRTLRSNLSARGIVDIDGPKGPGAAAVNLGRIKPVANANVQDVKCGVRQVLPLTEARAAFTLSLADLEDVARGAQTPELKPVVQAARKMALFEEQALYQGLDDAGIRGICATSSNESVALADSVEGLLSMAQDALSLFRQQSIGGPYSMVLGSAPYRMLKLGDQRGYPLMRRIEELLGGSVHWSPAIEGGVVVSQRGGDYSLTLGQDLSLGYTGQNGDSLEFFIVESFTFQVLEEAAAVVLK